MVMQEQSRRLAEPLQWGGRQKAAVGFVLAFLVLGLIALGVRAIETNNGAEARDCIRVTFASTLGGADLHGCGTQAKRICAAGSFRNIQRELQLACQHAGFPYKPPG